jgi:hypothetical protein
VVIAGEKEKGLAVIDGEFSVVAPLSSPEKALATWKAYEDLVAKLLTAEDYQSFVDDKGKPAKFIRKQGWRKLATNYGFTVEVLDERLGHRHDPNLCARIKWPEVFNREDKDCGCAVVFARYFVKAIAPNGRETTGVGLCAINEKNRKFTRQDHDIATTAYTRAVNRAIGDMIGVGKPSAEEARATGEASGLSIEERESIKAAWATAPHTNREQALQFMRDAGLKGENTADLFRGFARSADETAVADLLAILRTVEKFDPDDIGLGEPEPLPTEGGRTT